MTKITKECNHKKINRKENSNWYERIYVMRSEITRELSIKYKDDNISFIKVIKVDGIDSQVINNNKLIDEIKYGDKDKGVKGENNIKMNQCWLLHRITS